MQESHGLTSMPWCDGVRELQRKLKDAHGSRMAVTDSSEFSVVGAGMRSVVAEVGARSDTSPGRTLCTHVPTVHGSSTLPSRLRRGQGKSHSSVAGHRRRGLNLSEEGHEKTLSILCPSRMCYCTVSGLQTIGEEQLPASLQVLHADFS